MNKHGKYDLSRRFTPSFINYGRGSILFPPTTICSCSTGCSCLDTWSLLSHPPHLQQCTPRHDDAEPVGRRRTREGCKFRGLCIRRGKKAKKQKVGLPRRLSSIYINLVSLIREVPCFGAYSKPGYRRHLVIVVTSKKSGINGRHNLLVVRVQLVHSGPISHSHYT